MHIARNSTTMSFFDKTLGAYTTLSGRSLDDELKSVHSLCDVAVPFSLEGRSVLGRVCRVIDGDSMHVSMPIDGHIWTFPIRIENIDCPEVRTKNTTEKELGYKAKDHVSELVGSDIICIKLGEFDKFGRLLGTVYTSEGVNIAESLIENGLARRYDGGKRLPWT